MFFITTFKWKLNFHLPLSSKFSITVKVFPGNLLQSTYADPDDPDRLVGRSEVGRRQVYFDQLEPQLAASDEVRRLLIQMIKDCLRNAPYQRPTAEQLVRALEGMKGAIEGGYGELATVDAVRQVRTMKALKSRSEDKVNELTAKDEQIQQLQLQLAVRTDIIIIIIIIMVVVKNLIILFAWYNEVFFCEHRQLMSYVNKRYDKRMMKSSKRVLSWNKLRY